LAYLKDWKCETIFKNTARKTPQQNSYAELAFMVLAAKARAMLSAAQVLKGERFKLWGGTVVTVTALDNLIGGCIDKNLRKIISPKLKFEVWKL
jgi:hypothetical protein